MSSQIRRSNDQASTDVARLTEEVCELRCKVAELEGRSAGHGSSEQSAVEFRSIFERVGVGLGLADIQGRFLKTNRAFKEMLGYKSGELEGKNINDVTHPDDIGKTQSNRRQTIGREKPFYRLEKRYLAKDGQTIWAQVTSTPNFGPDGEFVYTMAVVEDITARREAEAALQRSESRLAEAQRVTNTGSWERDLATDEEFWSAQQYRLFGCDNRAFKVTNRKFLELVHPEDVARVQAENDRLGAAGGNVDLTFRIIRKDGVERIVRSRGAMVKNADGQHERTVGTMTDITDYHLAEQAMADSEGRFRAIFEGAPSGMIISSQDGVFQQCNPASARLLGYSVDELVGKHFSEITHPDDRADNIHLSDRLIIGDISNFDMEKRFLRKDGSVLWAHLSVSMTRDISGRPRSRIAIVEDISAGKEALSALEESQARLLESQQVANVGNWVIYYSGTEQALVHWSSGLCQIFGLVEGAHPINFEEYLGYVHPEDRDAVDAAWTAASQSGGAYEMDHRIVRPDGTIRHILSHAQFSDEDQEMGKRCVGASIDITSDKQAEAALRNSEARLEEAQRIAHIGNWEYDENTEIRHWSNECYRIFGRDKERFDPSGEAFFDCIHADDRERFVRNMVNHSVPREPHTHEYRIVRSNGDVRTLREHSVFEYDATGKLLRRAGTVQDITEQKQAVEQLHQAQKMEAVGQLTGGIAHDFNNLLAIMMGNLELVRDTVAGDERALGLIERGVSAAERGAALTHRLLAFSRRQRLQPSLIDMNELVADMIDMLRRTLGETVEVNIRAAENLWLCEVDRPQLENSLLNLAINARDAMAGGGTLLIETANCELDAEFAAARTEVTPGPYVLLSVSDDGAGIPGEALEHVFEPFFTTKEVGKGSGLGLSMIYGFVKQSGGHVEIESTPDEGTRIKIFLPRAMALAESGVEQLAPTIRAAKGECVLLVEDDAEVRDLVIALLKDMGYRVVAADTAETAMARLEKDSGFDLLFDRYRPTGRCEWCGIVAPGARANSPTQDRIYDRLC